MIRRSLARHAMMTSELILVQHTLFVVCAGFLLLFFREINALMFCFCEATPTVWNKSYVRYMRFYFFTGPTPSTSPTTVQSTNPTGIPSANPTRIPSTTPTRVPTISTTTGTTTTTTRTITSFVFLEQLTMMGNRNCCDFRHTGFWVARTLEKHWSYRCCERVVFVHVNINYYAFVSFVFLL